MNRKRVVSILISVAFLSACHSHSVPFDVTPEQIITDISEAEVSETEVEEETTQTEITEPPAESIDYHISETGMPEAFGLGCPRVNFHYQCVDKFHCLNRIFDEYGYENNFDLYQFCEIEMKINRREFDASIEDFVNLYTYMNYFGVSGEDMRMLMEKSNAAFDWENDYFDGIETPTEPYTEEDIEVLLSGDITAITAHFASPYSIVIGDKIYSPYWVYCHTAEDYETAGITPEMLLEKVELYSHAGFGDEARVAFENKLSAYIGRPVDLTYKE